jgi:insulysin
VARVLGFVFQYIDMLKREGVQQWVFEESRLLNKLNFDFLEKQAPFNYVSTLSNRMHYYKAEEVL